MVQRVAYGTLPNTPDGAFLARLSTILGYIEREKPDFKDLRTFLREQNVWHKDETPVVLDIVEIPSDGKRPVVLGETARKLLAANTDDEQKKVLFERLFQQNRLLMKYVLEALDVESGGRLHSTHELHRMLTSYVYPGEYVTLPNFQNWVKWVAIAGAIRVIGIRWGLGDLGKQALPRVRALDVEEFLDEEREATDETVDEAAPAPAPAAAPPAAPAPPPAAPAAAAPAPRATGAEDDEFPDLPPEPEPPAPEIVAAAEAALAAALVVEPAEEAPSAGPLAALEPGPGISQAARPVREVLPVPPPAIVVGPVAPQPSAITKEQLAENAARIAAWWQGYPHKRVLHAQHFDLNPKDFDTDRQVFLLELQTLSVLLDHERYDAPVAEFFETLRRISFFRRLLRLNESLESLLGEVDFFGAHAWHVRLSENLIHVLRFKQTLSQTPDPLAKVDAARSPADVVRRTATQLYGGAFFIEPFWLIREMVVLGLWDKPHVQRVAVVPGAQARTNAYRLGYLDSLYADGLPSLTAASQTLSAYFNAACDFDGALRQLHEGFGCRFRCPHVLTCPLHCREKVSL